MGAFTARFFVALGWQTETYALICLKRNFEFWDVIRVIYFKHFSNYSVLKTIRKVVPTYQNLRNNQNFINYVFLMRYRKGNIRWTTGFQKCVSFTHIEVKHVLYANTLFMSPLPTKWTMNLAKNLHCALTKTKNSWREYVCTTCLTASHWWAAWWCCFVYADQLLDTKNIFFKHCWSILYEWSIYGALILLMNIVELKEIYYSMLWRRQ